jgi:hypothetical protein
MAKNAPYPPCLTAQTGRLAPHDARLQLGQGLLRDSFLAKVPAPSTRGARCSPPTLLTLRSGSSIRSGQDRVTQPPHIAGPLALIQHEITQLNPQDIGQILKEKHRE